MKKAINIFCITFVIVFLLSGFLFAGIKEDNIKMEADYILSCQYINQQSQAHGAINDISGDPTWVFPRENAMAILGLIIAGEVLDDESYIERAQLAADYLIKIQDQVDGAWCNQYNFNQIADSAKSPTQTTEVMIALGKLGYIHNRYNSMKMGARYLMECQKVNNIGGFDHGLLGGGKDNKGQYNTWRWASDNSYAYWALKNAERWAEIEGDVAFSAQCLNSAQRIINGINTYLYNKNTGVWHIVIDGNGVSLGNPDIPFPNNNLPSWINYAPQMLDLPVVGVNSPIVGDWIKNNFQKMDGSCIAYALENGGLKTRKYPGYSFQASLCWFDTNQVQYANPAINWAENSGLWQKVKDGNGLVGGWIDWIEESPNFGLLADWWLRFIDTSFYSIACWDGGYNFGLSAWMLYMPAPLYTEEKPNYSAPAGCKMVLDYIREDNILTQDELYTYGKQNNHPNNVGLKDLDPQGVRSILNNYHKGGYNFEIRETADIKSSMRDICHWMDYEVPNVNVKNVPAMAPVYGGYSNWMAITGASASSDPSVSNRFIIYGLWFNDPHVNGIGANSYKTSAECKNTYLLPVKSQDIWNGKYISVCEPPDIISNAEVSIEEFHSTRDSVKMARTVAGMLQKPNYMNYAVPQNAGFYSMDQAYMEYGYRTNEAAIAEIQPQSRESMMMANIMPSQRSMQYARYAAPDWKGLIDKDILKNKDLSLAFNGSYAGRPIKVKRLDIKNNDYYIIPYYKNILGMEVTSVAMIIDMAKGYFKEISWSDNPLKYLPVGEKEAVKLAKGFAKKGKRNKILPKTIKSVELQWKPCSASLSAYYPVWKMSDGKNTLYVSQEGIVFEKY